MKDLKNHWENIYHGKLPHELSWAQAVPAISLEFIHKFNIPKSAKIIDVGGGDSTLVDHLISEGFSDVTVLDISEAAIRRAQQRLGEDSKKVKWILSDILDFRPAEKYDLWHDRAAFHFQTDPERIEKYLGIVRDAVDGMVIIGTFSVDGPKKCSGLDIRQYDEEGMKETFERSQFRNVECKREDHFTPSGMIQNFIFCSFKKQPHTV